VKRLPNARLLAYGALAVPLAMLSLPLYVHVPKLYAEQFGLALGTQGLLLLAARALDAVQDPWLGLWGDRARARGIGRRAWIIGGVPLLALATLGLFMPPAWAQPHIGAWLLAMLMLVHAALAMVQINYQADGAELSEQLEERARITAMREALTLLGVLAGVLLPSYCVMMAGTRAGYGGFATLLAVLLLLAAIVTVHLSPPARAWHGDAAQGGDWRVVLRPLANRRFRHLLGVFALNGTANAIPATLVLFYVDQVLGEAALAPLFLCSYFVAGMLAMPLWPWLARRLDVERAWLLGMSTGIVAFAGAALLGHGDVLPYLVICVVSGCALGADLALPPVLLATSMDEDGSPARGNTGGAYFGLWALVTKLSLALAAGIALPLLDALGDGARVRFADVSPLALLYALLPCVLKGAACLLLVRGAARPRKVMRARSASV
jgi:GPH family glycoside/pentoside/hexuronide:cation symporter